MSCNCPEPMDCCTPCPESPTPVLPRCDIALPDGTFTNSTVTVEGGCITTVTSGRPPQYSPATCCEEDCSGTGGSGTPGLRGPAGRDGDNATVTVGQVNTVAAGHPARVVNTGTTTNAVLDFYIPAGQQGQGGEGSAHGVTDISAGIDIKDGVITSLPAAWPPALAFTTAAEPSEVSLSVSQPDPTNGVVAVSINLSQFRAAISNWVNERIDEETSPLEARISQLESQLNALTSRVDALESRP